MRAILFALILYTFSSINCFSQNWDRIENTDIQFSNLIEEDSSNWQNVNWEYFKKGENLIIVEKNIASYFIKLFNEGSYVFDNVFNETSYVIKGNSIDRDEIIMAEKSLNNVHFEKAVIFTGVQVVQGVKECIWVLTNILMTSANPCYLNLVFNNLDSKDGEKKLEFIAAKSSYCEL